MKRDSDRRNRPAEAIDTVSHRVRISDRTTLSWEEFTKNLARANAAHNHRITPKDKELIFKRIKEAHTRPTIEEVNL